MIKLFASDLDGTLLNIFHNADSIVLGAIREAVEAGAHFATATGRTMRSNHDFGFDGLDIEAIGSNGSIILDRNGQVIKHYTIDPAFVEELLRTFPQVCFECIALDHAYITGTREERLAGFHSDGFIKGIVMRGMRGRRKQLEADCLFEQPMDAILARDICKINARVNEPGLERELLAFLDDHTDTIVNAPFNPVMFEITDKDVNKGVAVAWLARYLGFSEDEVAVYGDGGNDIAMLERFAPHGHAYATANGSDAAKRAAGNVIGNCALHAVPRHIKQTIRDQNSARSYTRID